LTVDTAFLPVLTFHDLEDQPSPISFPPRLFQQGIAVLYEKGYRTLSLLEAIGYSRRGQSFPERSFVLTFDDGYRSVYTVAFPVLNRLQMSATVFLTTGTERTGQADHRLPSLEGREMLAWGEIQQMHAWGIDFGAHTCTHPDLTRLTYERAETEIRDSKAIIEDALSAPAACFAYPYGRYDDRSRAIVRQHFSCACSDKLGLVTPTSDPHAVERVDAYYLRTEMLFSLLPSGLFPWYIRACSVPRLFRRTYLEAFG
jgi:peptidoglycan/xylan/chitin deacetylase (PgdA/CDA1 family)